LCRERNAISVNVNDVITEAEGGLAEALTQEGLHRNPDGSRAIASVL
jgi:hypothetical protein